ncbi:glucosyl transferase [Methylobacterium sp. A54F]
MSASGPGGREAGGVVFFGHDRAERTVIKRVAALRAAGWPVLGFMFRRDRGATAAAPVRDAADGSIDLGLTVDRNYLRRLPALAGGLVRALRHRRRLRAARLIYARNTDMAVLALLACRLAGARAPFVYEVLDVQRAFLRPDRVGALFRAVERWVLARTTVLVVSAPDFLTRYFGPVQGYSGRAFLLENKLFGPQLAAVSADQRTRPPGPPWVIGWFGTLRCTRSLLQLAAIADALGDRVRIDLRGHLSETDVDPKLFREVVASRPNMHFLGPYRSPEDLAGIYAPVHFSWSVDYHDGGPNSDWLLPNRIYEGGLFGALALARAGTATGRHVEAHGLGWALPEPIDGPAIALLAGLDRQDFARRQAAVAALGTEHFIDHDDVARLIDTVLAPAASHREPSRRPAADAGAPAAGAPGCGNPV